MGEANSQKLRKTLQYFTSVYARNCIVIENKSLHVGEVFMK